MGKIAKQSKFFIAEFCLQPTIGGVGLHTWAARPLPLVRVELADQSVRITRVKEHPFPLRLFFPLGLFKASLTCDYHDIALAQIVTIPGWLATAKRDKSLTEAVRLMMGASRARPVLMLHETENLLTELEHHGVKIDRVAKQLNRAWIGRK
jgi:hypothetical protein